MRSDVPLDTKVRDDGWNEVPHTAKPETRYGFDRMWYSTVHKWRLIWNDDVLFVETILFSGTVIRHVVLKLTVKAVLSKRFGEKPFPIDDETVIIDTTRGKLKFRFAYRENAMAFQKHIAKQLFMHDF